MTDLCFLGIDGGGTKTQVVLVDGCALEIGRATGVPTFTAASRYRLGMRRLKRLAGVPE